MKIRHFGLSALLMGAALSNAHAAQYDASEVARAASNTKIKEVVDLPIKGMKVIRSDAGIIFISDNGRFAFKGQLYDIWNQAQYDNLDDIKENAVKISLEKMRVDVDSLNSVTLGNEASGNPEVVVFVDPRCPYCHRLLEQAQRLTGEYTFKVVFLAILGKESQQLVQRIACANDKAQVVPHMLNSNLINLPTKPDSQCSGEAVVKSSITGNILGVRKVPAIISPNGTMKDGLVPGLAAWLRNN